MAEIEQWKPIPSFSRYHVSDTGRLRKILGGGKFLVIKPTKTQNGYVKYGLTDDYGRRKTVLAHRLVAFAFLPAPMGDAKFVLHANDDKQDNRFGNLRWGTATENMADAKKNNKLALGDLHPCRVKPWTRPRGERAHFKKLTECQVRAIMKDPRKQRDIAAEYGVNQALVGRIRTGKVWRHITDPKYRAFLEGNGMEFSPEPIQAPEAMTALVERARREATRD